MARNLYEMLMDIVFSFYPMEGYETFLKPRIIEKRTIIGIVFMMGIESCSMKPMKPSVPNDEEQ